ncbi:MAG: transcription antitermination factor NusB, partial [Bacillota bacterium]|nr:transcription antitermination factor NusB [Bacillota bacterium]
MKNTKQGMAARRAALSVLSRVEDEGAYVNLALSDILAQESLDIRDKRLAAEIAYGVVTYRLTLDWLITHVADRPAEKLDSLIRRVLRLGFYQLFYLDRIPASAAVNTSVELVKAGKKRGLSSFVNGVMRGALRKKNNLPWPKKE